MKYLGVILLIGAVGCASDTPRSQPAPPCVYVDGEVRQPGRFPWTNGITAADALQLAGGFNDFVVSHWLRVHHWDGTQDRYRLTSDFRLTNNFALRPGDAIYNPRW